MLLNGSILRGIAGMDLSDSELIERTNNINWRIPLGSVK